MHRDVVALSSWMLAQEQATQAELDRRRAKRRGAAAAPPPLCASARADARRPGRHGGCAQHARWDRAERRRAEGADSDDSASDAEAEADEEELSEPTYEKTKSRPT